MQSCTEILLETGDILYREGDTNDCAYIIESGEILLYTHLLGHRLDCERRGPGSIVGELSILTGQPRAVTVEAVKPCRIFRIPAAQILARFESLDPILRACIETSITFSAAFTGQLRAPTDDVPLVPSTLRDHDRVIRQFRFETDILSGLEAGEFSMVYQPIVDLADGRVVGAEALMRWEHDQLGPLSPGDFVPVAEAMGSITQLTEFALAETCKAMRGFADAAGSGDGFFLSVNISGKDIGRPGFVDHVELLIELHDIRPGMLRLELTETALCDNPEVAARNLQRLRAAGCGISVDDFGTGYSNLGYLKQLPLTSLKIDRAFAGDVFANPISKSIVKMLIGLGAEMQVDIIAEGLEQIEDVTAITELGRRFAQGFHFHAPMTAAALGDLLRSEAPRDIADRRGAA